MYNVLIVNVVVHLAWKITGEAWYTDTIVLLASRSMTENEQAQSDPVSCFPINQSRITTVADMVSFSISCHHFSQLPK
jgi:hypothetical protein